MEDKLTYADVINAVERQLFGPEKLNFAITKLLDCRCHEDLEPNLYPTGVWIWELPNGDKVKTVIPDRPDFVGNLDIARSLVPADRSWNYTFVPKKMSTAIVVAAPTFDGPGYRGVGDGAAALVIAALKARKGIGGLV